MSFRWRSETGSEADQAAPGESYRGRFRSAGGGGTPSIGLIWLSSTTRSRPSASLLILYCGSLATKGSSRTITFGPRGISASGPPNGTSTICPTLKRWEGMGVHVGRSCAARNRATPAPVSPVGGYFNAIGLLGDAENNSGFARREDRSRRSTVSGITTSRMRPISTVSILNLQNRD